MARKKAASPRGIIKFLASIIGLSIRIMYTGNQ